MKTYNHRYDYPFREHFADLQPLLADDFRVWYATEKDGKFYIIEDCSICPDFAESDDDPNLLLPIYEFESAEERQNYLDVRFKRAEHPKLYEFLRRRAEKGV